IKDAMRYFSSTIKKRSIAFLISDFIDSGYEDSVKIAKRKHDLIGIHVADKRESILPSVGWINLIDPETGKESWINTSRKSAREDYSAKAGKFNLQLRNFFKKSGIDNCSIKTGDDYIKPLLNLFQKR